MLASAHERVFIARRGKRESVSSIKKNCFLLALVSLPLDGSVLAFICVSFPALVVFFLISAVELFKLLSTGCLLRLSSLSSSPPLQT